MKHAKTGLNVQNAFLAIMSIFYVGNGIAANFLTENWDSGTPPVIWPYKNAPSPCPSAAQSNIFNGWQPILSDYCGQFPEWAQTGLSTSRAHSGNRSFYINRIAGQAASGDIRHDMNSPYPTRIYMRFYLWLDSNFINFNTPVSREPSYHFLFTNSAQSLTGLRINLLVKAPWTSSWQCGASRGGIPATQPYAFFSVQDYDREWPVGTYSTPCYNLLAHLNEWQCIEFMMDATNKTVTIWANGVQVYTGTDRITQTNFTMVQISNYMSNEGGSGFDTSYYIDDIVISDSYIGPSGTTPLPAPSNLRVIN